MTLDGFIGEWNGKYVDFDHSFGFQCVDLMRQYVKEVLNLDPYLIPRADYAKNIYKNFKPNQYLDKIGNTPDNAPPRGAIIFWGWRPPITGIAGHVAIVTMADVNHFVAFGQNYGKPNFCRLQNYDYRGVLGWIVPRKP